MAVLFAWNQRTFDRISFENLKLATELPDAELRRTLWVSFQNIFQYTVSANAMYAILYFKDLYIQYIQKEVLPLIVIFIQYQK